MITVKYPEPRFRIRKDGGKEMIFDSIRKQWLALTEEEWVRQNFVRFLVEEMKYPESLMALEKEIELGELKKRFDILVYDSRHQPWMLVECKAPEIKPGENVLQQILRYHIAVPAAFLVITNGNYTFAWEKAEGTFREISELPTWS